MMENNQGGTIETGIFDELKPLPRYYSPNTIYVFSLLFSVLFGAVLLAVNCYNTEGRRGVWQVPVIGLVFVAAEIWFVSFFDDHAASPLIFFNIGGAFLMKQFIWEKFIGIAVPYQKKSILLPCFAGLVIIVVALFVVFRVLRF